MLRDLAIDGAEGVKLHAVQSGERGRLMLFLHGFPEFWRAWHRQLAEFSRDFRAVALDLRGYNLSDKPPATESYALPRIVGDVRRVIRTLSPDEPIILVGHDWGGLVGWTLAKESPERLKRLVVVNAPHPAIFRRELGKNPAQMIASGYAAFFQLRGVAEAALRAFDFAALRKMIFGLSVRPAAFSPELREAYRDAWSRPGALSAGLNYYRNLRALNALANDAGDWTIHVPTLVLWGEKDPALRTSNLEGLDAFVPHLTLKCHAAATHWIVHEEPEWVNDAIWSFVREVRKG